MTDQPADQTADQTAHHTTQTDLTPAATALAAIATGVRDDQLELPTPCVGQTVGDLLHHVEGLATAFTWAAKKTGVPEGVDPTPTADATQLDPAWRTVVPERLGALARAWQRPEAWAGDTEVGGVAQSGAECGATCADELVVHAWDLARATGQPFAPDAAAVACALGFVEAIAGAMPQGVPGLFGAARPVGEEAPAFDRLLALTGRDRNWQSVNKG